MYSIWIYLKENTNCSSSRWSEVLQPEKICKDRKKSMNRPEKKNCGSDECLLRRERLIKDVSLRRSYTRERFYQLNVGDPSRNVIEMIFQTASTNSLKYTRKIERVLRVRNSVQTLKKFEEYREMVKRAHSNCARHPRCVVDGNELLQFYSTTMSCCSGKVINGVSEICDNTSCRVCRLIQSGFDTEDTKKTGIQLSSLSETLGGDNDMVIVANGDNVKKAVVVCRVIAGRVVNRVDGQNEEGFDSVGSEELCSKLDHVFVRNPNAVLPCFVIVCA